MIFTHNDVPPPQTYKTYRFFSSSYSTSSNEEGSYTEQSTEQSSTRRKRVNLRQLARPFFMTYHPDKQPLITRDVNLNAIQVLNELLDTIDTIVKNDQINNMTTLKDKYTIEFMVSSTKSGVSPTKSNLDHTKENTLTRRSVELTFSEKERAAAQQLIQTVKGSKAATRALRMIERTTTREIVKLLRVARLSIPDDFKDESSIFNEKTGDNDDIIADELREELDLMDDAGGGRFATGSRTPRPKTKYEKSRERFHRSVDWDKFKRIYDKAYEDAKRHTMTKDLINKSEERRQRLIADVISRIVVDEEAKLRDEGEEDRENSLDPLQQLIAVRRMSLLFHDHFEDLDMEGMGQIWQNVVIVLTRARNMDKYKTGAPFSKRKRIRQGVESGYKFAYSGDDQLTIYVPIDFL